MSETLRSRLTYEPRELKFGTSGRRGEIKDLTELEIYINLAAEIEFLQSLRREEGGIAVGGEFYFASDLRPSSPAVAHAAVRAIRDSGLHPVNLGLIPTPALTCYAITRNCGSVMITGSHIPFDRNGYKVNTSIGELLKEHEEPVKARVRRVRERVYNQRFADSLFDESGRLKSHTHLPPETDSGARAYIERYTSFFDPSLTGMKLLAYQHSAVGRDLLVEILRQLGAEVIPAGRSNTFVPIDTENIDAAQLAVIERLVDEGGQEVDAVVSTDGDSDRPLILDASSGRVRFFGGDLVGMVVASYLGADAVVVPVSCNDAIDRGELVRALEPKTRIGSPYVIAGMNAARAQGRRIVCGWEANGGFLTGSDIERNGRKLAALPTRDAVLPILAVLFAARENRLPLAALFDRLPKRFSKAALLKNFSRTLALRIVESFVSAADLQPFFHGRRGFERIRSIDKTDGIRITFENGEVAHLRPSGNADEFRFYAVADTQERADEIAAIGVAEPNGILRSMESAQLS
jgi:phosphomannomutase